jgi:hypothetical protein
LKHYSSFFLGLTSAAYSFGCRAVVPKLCSADHKGSVTSSQGIRGYISVMAAIKFTYFLLVKGTKLLFKIIAEPL